MKPDQRFETSCQTKKNFYPALSPNGLSEQTVVGKKAGAVRVPEYLYLVNIGRQRCARYLVPGLEQVKQQGSSD